MSRSTAPEIAPEVQAPSAIQSLSFASLFGKQEDFKMPAQSPPPEARDEGVKDMMKGFGLTGVANKLDNNWSMSAAAMAAADKKIFGDKKAA